MVANAPLFPSATPDLKLWSRFPVGQQERMLHASDPATGRSVRRSPVDKTTEAHPPHFHPTKCRVKGGLRSGKERVNVTAVCAPR
jgi:hypothetical protein